MVPGPVSLLDLPTELLLQILSSQNGLSSTDIFRVSLTSCRLLHIGLPVFLHNEGIPNPEEDTSIYVLRWSCVNPVIDGTPDALSALNLLPDLSKIKRFRCFFQVPDSKSPRNVFQKAFQLSDAVARVSRFVNKLHRVEVAEVYFIWDPYFIREVDVPHIPLHEVKRWVEAFGCMLNLIVERKCSSLTVQYDPSISPALHYRSEGSIHRAISYLRPRDDQPFLRWEFEQPYREGKSAPAELDRSALLSSTAQVKQSINSLSIHSPVLLLPPFVNWTLSLLRTQHNLTSLSFAYISFAKETWAIVLPFIADAVSARLTELQFLRNCPHLESVDLLRFIAHLPNLRRLTVDRTFRVRFQNYKPDSKTMFSAGASSADYHLPRFTQLSVLKAPVELVSILLGLNSHSGHKPNAPLGLPNLQDLTVYPSSLLIHPPSYVKSSLDVNDLLKKLQARPSPHRLVFSLDAQMEFTDFRPVFRYIRNINTSGEFQRTLWETLSPDDILKLTESGSKPHICFDNITQLILYKFNLQHAEEKPHRALCLWLHTLFPRVERLTFTYRLDAQPQQDAHMDEGTVRCLVKSLQEICVNVRVLVVEDKRYDIR